MTLAIATGIEMGNGGKTTNDGLEPPIAAAAPPQPNCLGRCCGRMIKDWTQVVGGVLAFGGLGAGGVGIATQDYLVIASGSVAILASSILLCARISCLKPKKELEKQVQVLGNEVGRLKRNEAKLKEIQNDLRQSQKNARESVVQLGNILKVPVDRADDIMNQIGAIEEKMRVLIDLYHRYKAASSAFSTDLKAFKVSNKEKRTSIAHLGKRLMSLDRVEDELSEEVGEYQDASEFQSLQNTEFRKMLSGFKSNYSAVQKRFVAVQSALADLKRNIVKIDEADDKFREGGKGFRQGVDQAQTTVIPKLEQMLEKLEKEVDELSKASTLSLELDGSHEVLEEGTMVEVVVHRTSDDDAGTSD